MSKQFNTKKQKEKIKLFGFDELNVITAPIIRSVGNKEVSVDGCRGVTDYYENLIKLSISGGFITFSGSGLKILSLTDTSALIQGTFEGLEFLVRSAK
jgi:sporulation protein YqfC